MSDADKKDEIFTQLLERLSELLQDITYVSHDLDELNARFNRLNKSKQHLAAYLSSEIADEEDPIKKEEMKEELDAVLNAPQFIIETEMEPDPKVREERANKTRMVIGVVVEDYNRKNVGFTPKEVFDRLDLIDGDPDITLPYVNNILSRFKAMGRLVQVQGKYHLTTQGLDYWRKMTGWSEEEAK